MKYIVLAHDFSSGKTQELPILFPAELAHAEVAAALMHLLPGNDPRVVAAGDARLDAAPRCSGRSDLMEIWSRTYIDGLLFFTHDIHHGLDTETPPNAG